MNGFCSIAFCMSTSPGVCTQVGTGKADSIVLYSSILFVTKHLSIAFGLQPTPLIYDL